MEDKLVIVMARLVAKPGMEDRVKFVLNSLIAPTRTEEGCVSYYFYQSVEDRTVFLSHEIWANKEAFANHLQTPYIVSLQEAGKDLLVGPLEITIVEPLS